MSQPDNFGLFMTLGALALWLCARGARGDRRAFVLGGLVVGLATLTRSDGLLLGIPFAIVGVRELVATNARPGGGAFCSCGRGLRGPVRDRHGAVDVPPNGGLRLVPAVGQQRPTDLADRLPAAVQHCQPAHRRHLARSGNGRDRRQPAWWPHLFNGPVRVCCRWLWCWHRSRSLARGHAVTTQPSCPCFVYAVALFAVMALVFPVLVPHGTFIHAASALVPHTFLLVVAGIGSAVGWVAQRRPTWNGARATVVFSYGAVVLVVLAAAIQTTSTLSNWAQVRAVQANVARVLQATPAADRVMAADPGAYNYLADRAGRRHSQRSAAGDRGHDARLRRPLAGPRAGSDRARAGAGTRGRCPSVMALTARCGGPRPAIRCDRSRPLRRLPDRFRHEMRPMTRRHRSDSRGWASVGRCLADRAVCGCRVGRPVRDRADGSTLATSLIHFPLNEGSAYYAAVSQNLAAGRGLVIDSIWSYATDPLILPRPAFELWQPLASLVYAVPMPVLGQTFSAAQLGAALLGALVAPLAWLVARDTLLRLALPERRAGSWRSAPAPSWPLPARCF